jgi:hypothetical protein
MGGNMSIAINEEQPKTTSKYEAVVTPQGKDMWSVKVEEVRYFTADPDTVYGRSMVFQRDNFAGTEEEVRELASEKIKDLVSDRDAIKNKKTFTITEDDCV